MTKTGSVLLFIVAFLNIDASVAASTSTKIDQKEIKVLLAKLGIAALVEDIPTTMKNGLLQKQQEKGIEKNQQQTKVSMVVSEYFSGEKILDDIATRLLTTKLGSQFQDARYESIQKLLNAASATSLVVLKHKSRSTEGVEEIKKLSVQHAEKPLATARLQLFESYDNAAAETEFSIAVQALSIDAILKITSAAASVNSEKQPADTKQDVLSSTYQLLLRPSRYTTMMTLQYMFDGKSDEDIKQYILIYRQKQLQWLLQNAMLALTDAMQNATNMAIEKIK